MVDTLIVSCVKKNISFFCETLNIQGSNFTYINQITVLPSIGEARRALLEKDYDLIIVDSPLEDETGEDFSRQIASNSISLVILAVNNEHYYTAAAVNEKDGVLVISKPIDKDFFITALSLARSANIKLKHMQTENSKLKQKIEDIRIIDRAKYMLISYLNLNEQEAHRFIEKQAMDLRCTKRSIAEGILKTYAS